MGVDGDHEESRLLLFLDPPAGQSLLGRPQLHAPALLLFLPTIEANPTGSLKPFTTPWNTAI